METDFVVPNDDAIYGAQTVTYTGTAGSVTGWNPGPRGVLVWTTTDAYVKVGEAAAATTASTPIPAYTPVLFRVPRGTVSTWRVSAIQIASGGSVYAKPVN